MSTPVSLPDAHFSTGLVEVRTEDVRLTDGRRVGTVVVAETPTGSVTRWAGDALERAWLEAWTDAAAGEHDPVAFADVVLRHSTDSHIDGGTVRAVAPAGCKTVWGDREDGCTPDAVRRALMPVLRGEVSCPLCGHDYLTEDAGVWTCEECEREAHP